MEENITVGCYAHERYRFWGHRRIPWAVMSLDLFMGRKEGGSEMLCVLCLDIMNRDKINEDWVPEQALLVS